MPSHGEPLSHSILEYLVRHPDAKDTAEGVLNWWIATVPDGCDESTVAAALEGLVSRQWLTRRQGSAGSIYSLNHARLNEIRRFLGRDERTT